MVSMVNAKASKATNSHGVLYDSFDRETIDVAAGRFITGSAEIDSS